MLNTNQTDLLRHLVALQDEVDFFLESVDGDPTSSDYKTWSEFIEGVSSFLKNVAEINFHPFKDENFIVLVKQPQILNLIFALRVDISLVIQNVKSSSKRVDEVVLSEFLQQLLRFLEVSGLKEESRKSISDVSHQLSTVFRLPSATTASAPHISPRSSPHQPHLVRSDLDQTELATRALRNASSDLINTAHNSINYGTASPKIITHGLVAPRSTSNLKPKMKHKHTKNSQDRLRRTLLFSNPSPNTTFLDISEWCCGGALESIQRYEKSKFYIGWEFPNNFLIQFIKPKDARAFLASAKSSKGNLHHLTENKAEIAIEWSPYQQDASASTFATTMDELGNPARRVLIFQGYPVEAVSKDELIQRLQALGRGSFHAHTILSFEISSENREAQFLFTRIEIAMRVMEFHKLGYLGDELSSCSVVFGGDPCDRPRPKKATNDPANILVSEW